MKKVIKFMVLAAVVITVLLSFCACQKSEATEPAMVQGNPIVGTWQDSYGLTKYRFMDDGKMKIQALNIGSFKGNYQMESDNITIEYNVLLKKEKNTYHYQVKDNKLYLDGKIFTRKK